MPRPKPDFGKKRMINSKKHHHQTRVDAALGHLAQSTYGTPEKTPSLERTACVSRRLDVRRDRSAFIRGWISRGGERRWLGASAI